MSATRGLVKNPARPVRLSLVCAALASAGLLTPPLMAAPTEGVVRAGQASIEQQGTLTRVTQRSDRAIIDWRDFSVDASEVVRFEQPGAQSALLNRVTGEHPSLVFGRIDANGRVFLVNPNGIVFGRDAQINVGGLIASTANISNQDFMAGKLDFSQPGKPGASIRNSGRLTAEEGGLIALVAPHVRNDGVITARLGKVVLGAGDTYTLDLHGDQLVSFALDPADAAHLLGQSAAYRVDHAGEVHAAGGQAVFVTAATGKAVLDNVINLSGVVRADTVRESAGRILLMAGDGRADVSGQLSAHGESGQGGTIEVLGDRVELAGARLDASGAAGGGTIRVGGAWQGQGDTYRAHEVAVATDSLLVANATRHGNGGEIVVWSDGANRFDGSASARGGAAGGDGGRIEVSGKTLLSFQGQVDAGASAGEGGLFLLDPYDLTIRVEEAQVLSRILRTGTSTALQADHDITVDAAIDGRGLHSGGGLSLTAGHDIHLNDFIVTQAGAVNLTATEGTVRMAPGIAVFAGSAPIRVQSGSALSSGALFTSDRLSLVSTAGAVRVDVPIEPGNGALDIQAAGDIEFNAPVVNLRSGAPIVADAGGDILVNAQIDGLEGVAGGTVEFRADQAIRVNQFIATRDGAITLNSGAGTDIGASGGLYAGSAPIQVTATGDLRLGGSLISSAGSVLDSLNGNLSLDAPIGADHGPLSLHAAGTVTVNQPIVNLRSGATLTIASGQDIDLRAQIDGLGGSPGGRIDLNAGRDLVVHAALATESQPITAQAGGAVRVDPGAGFYTGSAPVTVTAGGDLVSGIVASNGSIQLHAGGSLTANGAIAGAGGIDLDAARSVVINQPIDFGSGHLGIDAGDAITVNARLQGDQATLALNAGGGIALNEQVAIDGGSLALNAGSGVTWTSNGGLFAGNGTISVTARGSYTVGTVATAGRVSLASTQGSLTLGRALTGHAGAGLSAAGNVVLDAPIADFSPGAGLDIWAGSNLLVNAQIDDISGGINLGAMGNIYVNQSIVTPGSPITLSAGGTVVQAADGVDAYGAPLTQQVRANGGAISVTTGGDYHVGSLVTSGTLTVRSTGGDLHIDVPIYETTGYTRMTAAGDILVNQVVANTTTGHDLLMQAGGDIEVDAKIGPWDRTTGTTIDRNAVPGGQITLVAGNDINVHTDIGSYRSTLTGADAAAIRLTATAGTITLDPGIKVMSDRGAIYATAGSDLTNGILPATPNINSVPTMGYFTTGALNLTSTQGSVIINQNIPDTTGAVTITAGDGIEVNQRIYTNNADIHLTAGAGGIWMNPTPDVTPMVDGITQSTIVVSDIDAHLGNITLEAVGDIRPTLLRSRGSVVIRSTEGSLIGGKIENSRASEGVPVSVELAGYAGIDGFNTINTPNVSAISANGSILNLGFYNPANLMLVAHDDIINPTSWMGMHPRLFAGRDMQLRAVVWAGDLVAKAGRHLSLVSADDYALIAGSVQFSSGYDPFVGLEDVSIAGVSVPAWSGPLGPGNFHGGTPTQVLWIEGIGGFQATATGSITLPKVHVSYTIDPAVPSILSDPRHAQQPFLLDAGTGINLGQIETMGPVSLATSTGNISIGSTIGAHVAPDPNKWNPTDLGVASLLIVADAGNIEMHEARAVGDITIRAPLGQVTFVGGLNGIESAGTRVVEDSDGVVFSDTIDATPVARLPKPAFVAPAISVGPTIAGPGAPAIPGAPPPAAPAGVNPAGATPAAFNLAMAGPNGTVVDGQGPLSSQVSNTSAPAGSEGDSFGEVFVAETAAETAPTQAVTEASGQEQAGTEVSGTQGGETGTPDAPAQTAREEASEPGPGQATTANEAGGSPAEGTPREGIKVALAPEEEDEEEAKLRFESPTGTYVVFEGGRGDAKQKDFGNEQPLESGRVRP